MENQRKFTWQELSRLNKRDNAHVAFCGRVYDVSGFLASHPGGSDQLMLGAGRDITQLFMSYHKPGTAKLLAEKCKYVGDLIDNEMPTFAREEGKFYETVKKRVAERFKSARLDPKIDYYTFCRYGLFCVLASLFWYLGIRYHSTWSCYVFAALYGFLSAVLTLTICHDGNHFAITHKPQVWKMLSLLGDSIHGKSSLTWTYQHCLGHHLYTNINNSDPDTLTFNDGTDKFRIRCLQQWFPVYIYQHLYMPFLYTMFMLKMKLEDFASIFSLQVINIRINPPSFSQLLLFYTAKAIHFSVRYFIPFFLMPFSTFVLLTLVSDVIHGLYFTIIIQVTHVTMATEWPQPEKMSNMDSNWAEMQVATTQDYATDSWIWTVLTGAANHQVAHHLFPGVLQSYYPLIITPIVRETCTEFGLQYHHAPSIWEAIRCHFRYLRQMGSEPKKHEFHTQ